MIAEFNAAVSITLGFMVSVRVGFLFLLVLRTGCGI